MAARASFARVFQVNIQQLMALLRDPAFQINSHMEFVSEMPFGYEIHYRFRHGVTFTSWGENILIKLIPSGPDLVNVEVFSECVMPTQFIDWGVNNQNVNNILAYISYNLPRYVFAAASAAPGAKFCSACGTRLDASAAFCSACGAKQG